MKRHYCRQFRDSFRAVLATLSIDERNVLRLYFLDGMTLAAIAVLYKVHHSTVARWIEPGRA